jgi:hypothetical protein
MSEVTCRECSAVIPSEHIKAELGVAACQKCHRVFLINEYPDDPSGDAGLLGADAPPATPTEFDQAAREARQAGVTLSCPERLTEEMQGDMITLSWGWNGLSLGQVQAYSAIATVGMLFLTIMMVLAVVWRGETILLKIGGAVVIGALFCFAYIMALATLKNRTELSISRQHLVMTHGPVAWPSRNAIGMLGGSGTMPVDRKLYWDKEPASGVERFGRFNRNIRIDAAKIDQVYCVEQEFYFKAVTKFVYGIILKFKDGTQRPLVYFDREPTSALYLEYRIEQHLDLTDEPVEGELPRGGR